MHQNFQEDFADSAACGCLKGDHSRQFWRNPGIPLATVAGGIRIGFVAAGNCSARPLDKNADLKYILHGSYYTRTPYGATTVNI